MLWCFLCPWTFIFQALPHLPGFNHCLLCLWQLLVRFEISPFYQDVRCGSQIGFVYKSNAFTVVFDATIIKPKLLQLYFQNMQTYKSLISTVWNETITKIPTVVSSKKTIQNLWFWNTLCNKGKNPQVVYAKFGMKPIQKSINWFHLKETMQHQWFWNTFFIRATVQRFYKQGLKWNHFKH